MLQMMIYDITDVLSQVIRSHITNNFHEIIEVVMDTENLREFVYRASSEKPDILMIDLDYNNTEDNVINALIRIVDSYKERFPMIIMLHSEESSLFTDRYEVLSDIVGENICLIPKPYDTLKTAICVMKRLASEMKPYERPS